MQEEIENRSVTLVISASKLTLRALQDAIRQYLAEQKYKTSNTTKPNPTKGNNGLKKTRYITFGIEAESYRIAKQRLERIELDILHNFKQLGVAAAALNGKERLQLMHGIFRMGSQEEAFRFDWKLLAASGLSTKDFIAPSSFEFREGRSFRMGKRFGAISFLSILAPELNDRMLADFLDMQSSLIVSMHIQSVDQNEAIKTIKRKITDLDKMKMIRKSAPATVSTCTLASSSGNGDLPPYSIAAVRSGISVLLSIRI